MNRIIWNQKSRFLWNEQTVNNDMVLLKLESALDFNTNVNAACLPQSNWKPGPEKTCFTSGWGKLDFG